jgi:hypothetical protein
MFLKRSIAIVLAILVVLGVGGKSQEVRDRAFVEAVTVRVDGNIYASIKLYGDDTTYMGIGDNLSTAMLSAESRQAKAFFLGHTELLVFSEDSFSREVVLTMLKDYDVSPNCAVVVSSGEVYDTQTAYEILKTYDRLGEVSLKTASQVVRELNTIGMVSVPLLSKDLTYTTTVISL